MISEQDVVTLNQLSNKSLQPELFMSSRHDAAETLS
jgi:hypothetical protein